MKVGGGEDTQTRPHLAGLYIVCALDMEIMSSENSYLRLVAEKEKTTMIVLER
jgi:hypothetical protein